MSSDLIETVNQADSLINENEHCHISSGFYTPGFLVVLAATLNERKIGHQDFSADSDPQGYFEAVGLPLALWGIDEYSFARKNVGNNYSMITCLNAPEHIDACNTQIAGCLRSMVGNSVTDGFSDLIHVVGELHDNVWSHGKDTGFSHAQRWKVPYTNGEDHYLEFALADKGLGFLQEMNRVGKGVDTHQSAIEWCIGEGHSTKHADEIDEWAQSVPSDFAGGAPFSPSIQTRINDGNHHQGLGLHHLLELVKTYSGELKIISGDSALEVDERGNKRFITVQNPWQGVAISCRVKESCLLSVENEASESVQNIMDRLTKGGGFS